ncbi:MAG: acyl-CoA thioesterase [Spirochaetaceae bacterium]|nr:MAG: acyl-CoA thioesterase [Spirochaetaceae bacterium]
MPSYRFRLEFAVRDYECDLEGVVNNAVYLNYLEHCRHEFLRSVGVDFAAVVAAGTHMVVTRAEVDYRRSLTSGDRFWIGLDIERPTRLKLVFVQDVYRLPDDELIAQARITGAALSASGRPVPIESVSEQFAAYIAPQAH